MSGSVRDGTPRLRAAGALRRLALVLATASILAAVAPLRTSDLDWLPRLVLFLLATLAWEAAIAAAIAVIHRWRPGWPATIPGFAAVVVLASVPATAVLIACRVAAGQAVGRLPVVYAGSLLLGLLVAFARRGLRRPGKPYLAPAAPSASSAELFLRRHAASFVGRRLVALEAEDHYLRIHTDAGSALVLLRLRDAVAELGDAAGWQPHRSFWLAADAGGTAVRRGQAWQIQLPGGLLIPVSKSATPSLRTAGYTPGA